MNFYKKTKKKKTIIMFPENQYTNLVEKKLKILNLNNFKVFKYNPNPEVLDRRDRNFNKLFSKKKNLELRRKKCLKIKKMNNR